MTSNSPRGGKFRCSVQRAADIRKRIVTKIKKSEDDWRKELTPAQFNILRNKGTEPPFSGKYATGKAQGVFKCAGCGAPLFDADTKYDSGSGWPSFIGPVSNAAVDEHRTKVTGLFGRK